MLVCHRNSANDRADDSNESLIRSTKKEIVQTCCAVELLFRSTINSSVVVGGESPNCLGSKDIGVDNMTSKIGHESNGCRDRFIVPPKFFGTVLLVRKCRPSIVIRDGCQSYKAGLGEQITPVRRSHKRCAGFVQ
jgi:hypothetical protein